MKDLELARCHLILAADTIDPHNPTTAIQAMSQLHQLREDIARLETELAAHLDICSLGEAGVNPRYARVLLRRAEHEWEDGVEVEHQDEILRALSSLSPGSDRGPEIYREVADEVRGYTRPTSPEQTWRLTRDLVHQENLRLATDPLHARTQRRFTLHAPDEHGGAKFSGYATPETSALLQALMDQAFSTTPNDDGDLRTVAQRQHDAFATVVRWASSNRVESTGHASLVVSITESDPLDLSTRFPTNTGFGLNLLEILSLGADRITDYIAVHTHSGAVKMLITGNRLASFEQRVAMLAEQLVCQYPGCDVHAGQCDAHHAVPWTMCQETALENLGFLCRKHHRKNHDDRKGPHLKKDQHGCRWSDSQGEAENNSPAAKKAAGRRLRKTHRGSRQPFSQRLLRY